MEKTIHKKEHKQLIYLLRELREKQGLTQSQLAQEIGSDQTFISKIENSERRIDLIELRTICLALQISLTDFVVELESRLEKYLT